jgi:hypothetical protein
MATLYRQIYTGGEPKKELTADEIVDSTRFGRFKNSWFGKLRPVRHLIYAMTVDVHANMSKEGHEHIAQMHAAAEVSSAALEKLHKNHGAGSLFLIMFIIGGFREGDGVLIKAVLYLICPDIVTSSSCYIFLSSYQGSLQFEASLLIIMFFTP